LDFEISNRDIQCHINPSVSANIGADITGMADIADIDTKRHALIATLILRFQIMIKIKFAGRTLVSLLANFLAAGPK